MILLYISGPSSSLYFLFIFSMVYCTMPQPQFTISMYYLGLPIDNITEMENATIYNDNQLSNNFLINQGYFDCANYHLFVLNQTQQTSNYTLMISDFLQPLTIRISEGYNKPVIDNLNCTISPCFIQIQTNCTEFYSNSFVSGTVSAQQGALATQFNFFTQCNINNIEKIQDQWGYALIALSSIVIIWVSSKFQQAQSFNNYTLYVNYIAVTIYSILCFVKFLLVFLQVPHIVNVISDIWIIISFIFGPIATMICFCEFMYLFKIGFLQQKIFEIGLKLRIMDILGLLLGIMLICVWFFLGKNMIISNIIFIMVYISFIKIIKVGSLQILIIIFAINYIIIAIFYKTALAIDGSYQNPDISYFNNPCYLLFPNLVHQPNCRCAWYSIIPLIYAGLYIAYLQRFDRNISSLIYGITFISCYFFGSVLWLIISSFTPFFIPYLLLTIPISTVFLMIFANRRGELTKLWKGFFFDEQRGSFDHLHEMAQNMQTDQDPTSHFASTLLDHLVLSKEGETSKVATDKKNTINAESSGYESIFSKDQTKMIGLNKLSDSEYENKNEKENDSKRDEQKDQPYVQ